VSPSSSQNSVVQLRSGAIWLVVDSAAVELERRVRSIDGNAGWSSVNLHLEVILVSLVNIDVSSESGTAIRSFVNAGSVLCSVWVAGLSVDSLGIDDVLHSLSHESSIASLVSLIVRAINEVLLGQADELLRGEEVASLSGSSGGEGPARTALLLVLNMGDGSQCVPVPLGGKSFQGSGVDNGHSFGSEFGSKHFGIFDTREVRKLVESNLEGLVGVVVSSDEFQVGTEDSVSVKEFIVVITPLVLLHPEGESRLVLRLRESEGDAKNNSKSKESLHLVGGVLE
jgi:hypothetical protein